MIENFLIQNHLLNLFFLSESIDESNNLIAGEGKYSFQRECK